MENSLNLNASIHVRTFGELMLSFELSAIDIVLAIGMIILLVLFIRQRTGRTVTKSRLLTEDQEKEPLEHVEKPNKTTQIAKKKLVAEQPPEGFQECTHQFGYLKNMPKNATVPNECLGCPKLVRCLFPKE